MTEFEMMLKARPILTEEATQLAGRFEFEDGLTREKAEARTIGALRDKYNMWGSK